MVEPSSSLTRILNVNVPVRDSFPYQLAISPHRNPFNTNTLPEIQTPERRDSLVSRSSWTAPGTLHLSPSIQDTTYDPHTIAGPSQHQPAPRRASPVDGFHLHSKHPSISPSWFPGAINMSRGLPSIASPADMRSPGYRPTGIPTSPDLYPPYDPQQSSSSQKRGLPEIDPFEYQPAERASVRIAAATPTSYSHYYPPNQRSHHPERNIWESSPTFQSHAKDRTRPREGSQKRGVFDVEDAEEPPKSKRKLNAKPGPNKRGNTTKKLRESGTTAALSESDPDIMYTLTRRPMGYDQNESPYKLVPAELPAQVNMRVEIQEGRCMAGRYKNEDEITRCIACIRRLAGDTCRFQFVRLLFRDSENNIKGFGFQERELKHPSPMVYPDTWNIPLLDGHIHEIKKTIASALLPTLCEELQHIGQEAVVYRARESEVRATCDTCLTSIFSCSWMCRLCGREACADCFQQVKKLTVQPENASEREICDLKVLRDRHAHLSPSFLVCMKKKNHSASHFSPMSRFNKSKLVVAIEAMKKLLKDEGIPLPEPSTEAAASEPHPAEPMKVTLASMSNSCGAQTPPDASSPLSNDSNTTLISDGNIPPSGPDPAPIVSTPEMEIPAHEIRRFQVSELTEEIFRPLWAQGDPLLVMGVGRKLKINWSPKYFTEKYGAEPCVIIECQSDANKPTTVAEFFSDFGQYEGRDECWKLKDWPPSSDFKTAFPELYEDFSQAVPIPNYVRRDGVLNLASHFPSNTVAPDLGPKMYNANANRVAIGPPKGSTRLHMDMADALNIMTFAAQGPDGEEGCAAWDLFRAQDSDVIRQFLRERYITIGPDPIHSQQVYLNDEARRELWEQRGVKSYRVYQKAGEAVFIPAGCAHQVRNLSDCVKVAIDFVSPENIARCEKLTREFRAQNEKKVWKEDVLQLRSMMWFAWLSCCRQEQRATAKAAAVGVEAAS